MAATGVIVGVVATVQIARKFRSMFVAFGFVWRIHGAQTEVCRSVGL